MTDNKQKPSGDETRSLNNLPLQRPNQQGSHDQVKPKNQQGGSSGQQGNSGQPKRK